MAVGETLGMEVEDAAARVVVGTAVEEEVIQPSHTDHARCGYLDPPEC